MSRIQINEATSGHQIDPVIIIENVAAESIPPKKKNQPSDENMKTSP